MPAESASLPDSESPSAGNEELPKAPSNGSEDLPKARCIENEELAAMLEQIAELLEAQHANPFRVGAYRTGARTLREAPRAVADVFAEQGIEGLEALPGIGRSLASLIREYVRSGRVSLLERMSGSVSAEEVLATVPGLGQKLAKRIHEELGIETLEELECACHDGRLLALPGFGQRRVDSIAACVAAQLGRPGRRASDPRRDRPSVAVLLDVDREYRSRAAAGTLPRIAPRRFNPEGRAWLPVLHSEREGWDLTALFSNSARAHRLGRTHDWVVIYAERNGFENQCTVVNARGGGRVVRGRESECETMRGSSHSSEASHA